VDMCGRAGEKVRDVLAVSVELAPSEQPHLRPNRMSLLSWTVEN
jgi:hypothetical protein